MAADFAAVLLRVRGRQARPTASARVRATNPIIHNVMRKLLARLALPALWLALNLATTARAETAPRLPLPASAPTIVTDLRVFWLPGAGGVVEWTTASETGCLDFELWRAGDGPDGWERVGARPMAALNSQVGAGYRVVDRQAGPRRLLGYKLTARHASGLRSTFGPLTLAARPAPAGMTAEDTAFVLEATPAPPVATGREAKDTSAVPPVVVAGQPLYVKMTTTNAGLHMVRASALAPLLSLPLTEVQAAILNGDISLFSQGEQVRYVPSADGAALFFYARAMRNNYTYENVYWLVSLPNGPVPTVPGLAPAANPGQSVPATLHAETNALALPDFFYDPETDFWMWVRFLGGNRFFGTNSVPFVLDRVTTNGAPNAQITLRVFGKTTAGNLLLAEVNTNVVSFLEWQGADTRELTTNFPSAFLKPGTNWLRLSALLPAGTTSSEWYLNNFSLGHSRPLVATRGLLDFCAGALPVVTVGGFSNSAIAVLEVTDPSQPRLVTGLNIEPAGGLFRASFVPATPDACYVAFDATALPPAPGLKLAQLANLAHRTNRADYLIITTDALAPTAQELATYRQGQGLVSKIVTVNSVLDEFAWGLSTPQALKGFLTNAWATWALRPRYVLLAGDGTYDYRDILGYHNNVVPTMTVGTLFGLCSSDPALGDLDGDEAAEMAIGRLPALSAADLQTMITKIKNYEARGTVTNPEALLMADFPQPGGNDFVSDIIALQNQLSPKYTATMIYPSVAATMRSNYLAKLNSGVDLTSYHGHGAPLLFGSSLNVYFQINDVAALTNLHRLPVLVAMTCRVGEFGIPGTRCIGEEMVLRAQGGAIAVFAASGLSLNSDVTLLNQRLMWLLRTDDRGRLGDFIRVASQDYVWSNILLTGPEIYNLIGDPALKFSVSRPGPIERGK